MLYVELAFSGDTPDVNVSTAPNYRVVRKNLAGALGVVRGDFDATQITTLIAASKTLLTGVAAKAKLKTYTEGNHTFHPGSVNANMKWLKKTA